VRSFSLIVNVNLIFLVSQTSLVYGTGHSTFVIHRGMYACTYHIHSWHSYAAFCETACETIHAVHVVTSLSLRHAVWGLSSVCSDLSAEWGCRRVWCGEYEYFRPSPCYVCMALCL